MKFAALLFACLHFFVIAFSQSEKDSARHVQKTYFLLAHFDNSIDTIEADTMFFQVHQYNANVFLKGTTIGNGACAFYDYTQPYLFYQPFWLQAFTPYYQHLSKQYMHTHVPFTQIRLIANTNRTYNEEIARLVHSQNINRAWNVSLEGLSNKQIGKLPHTDNRFHYLAARTNYQGKQYQLWASYFFSRFKVKENGGVKNPSFLTDSLFPAENTEVFLQQANNVYSIQQFNAEQWFNLKKADSIMQQPTLWITQSSSYFRSKKIYKDSPLDTTYYYSIFYDSLQTYDSLFYQLHKHGIGLAYANRPKNGKGFSLVPYILLRQSYTHLHSTTEQGILASLSLWNHSPNSSLSFMFSCGIHGFVQNEKEAQLSYNRKLYFLKQFWKWQNKLTYSSRNADNFEKQFFSNHYQWQRPVSKPELIGLQSALVYKQNEIRISFKEARNVYYVVPDSGLQQFNHSIIQASLEFSKLFSYKFLHFYNRILAQWLSDTLFSGPALSAYHSVYAEWKMFKKVLTLQLGADVWYTSRYKTPGYSPVLNTFYYSRQNNEAGFYPFTSVFLNAHLKRAMFFVKMEHLNNQWQQANFFLIENYPLPPRMLKFGIFWNFYD